MYNMILLNVLPSQLFSIITHDDTVPKRENIVCKSSSYNLKRKTLIINSLENTECYLGRNEWVKKEMMQIHNRT